MRPDGRARARIIEQIGSLDTDISGLQQQIVAMRSRRFELVMMLDDDVEDTDALDTLPPAPEEPAWFRLAAEVGPASTGEHTPVQEAVKPRRRREGYTPITISATELDDWVSPRERRREINVPIGEPPPQVHLHYTADRQSRYETALCGARAGGDYGWWVVVPDDRGEIRLCLGCIALMRSYR